MDKAHEDDMSTVMLQEPVSESFPLPWPQIGDTGLMSKLTLTGTEEDEEICLVDLSCPSTGTLAISAPVHVVQDRTRMLIATLVCEVAELSFGEAGPEEARSASLWPRHAQL